MVERIPSLKSSFKRSSQTSALVDSVIFVCHSECSQETWIYTSKTDFNLICLHLHIDRLASCTCYSCCVCFKLIFPPSLKLTWSLFCFFLFLTSLDHLPLNPVCSVYWLFTSNVSTSYSSVFSLASWPSFYLKLLQYICHTVFSYKG